MPSRFDRLVRAAATQGGPVYKKGVTPALGNLKSTGGSSGGRGGPVAATQAIQFQSPGMPMALDQEAIAFEGAAYAQNVFVMRCIQTIATTIAGLPFKAGLDPFDPGDYDPTAPLAQLLGPATPQAPGGPNPTTSARMLWDWTIKQYITYGRMAWETQLAKVPVPGARRRTQDAIVALWPLVSQYIAPVPTDGGQQMFDGFIYQTARSQKKLKNEQVFYGWKPRHDDWRQSESVLDAARFAIDISVGLDKYMSRLLQNDMVATTMVVTPPFAESAGRRAFRQQFRARYTGVDKAGGTLFGEAHRATGDTSGNPLMQIEKIAQTAVEASLIQVSQQAKIDITIALGVPMSLIGNASQRCLRASEYVRLANGERHQAKDMVGKVFTLLTSTPDGPIEVEASAAWESIDPCFAVTTESGRRIEANGRHPLWAGTYETAKAASGRRRGAVVTSRGWTKIEDLKAGDLVAVPDEFAVEGNDPLTVDEATVLGALIGDGCSTGTGITLTSPDSVEVQTFVGAVERLGDTVHRHQRPEGACDVWGISGGNVRKLLATHELLGKKGHDKFVPSAVFAAKRESQIAFLQALYAADGCAHWAKAKVYNGKKHYGRAQIDLTSVSAALVRDVQELLIRFGISGRIIPQKTRFDKDSELRPSFRLCLQTANEVLRFLDEIGIPAKAEQCAGTREVAVSQMERGASRGQWRKRNVNRGLHWEKIASIESVGIDQTVGISVPGQSTYLGTFWEHNTYANADSEYKNFWTITVLPLISDIQDYVNTFLAPRIGAEVGWFDLSKVAALKAPALFAPPMIGDAINFGVATAEQVANVLGIPAANATADADTDTIDVGVESATSTSLGGRSERAEDRRVLYGITKAQLLSAYSRWEHRSLNTHNVDQEFGDICGRYIEREHITVRSPKEKTVDVRSPEAVVLERRIERVQARRAAEDRQKRLVAAAALAERTEAMAEQARKEFARLRAEGHGADATDLEEAAQEAIEAGAEDRATWVGLDGHTTENLTAGEIATVHEHADPAKALTTWDGDPATLDDWVDANESALEKIAGA